MLVEDRSEKRDELRRSGIFGVAPTEFFITSDLLLPTCRA